MNRLKQGDVIGIFGGGQLGRMLAQSASDLGFKTHVFDPFEDTPAGRVADMQSVAEFEDLALVKSFAKACNVITYEFENIPAIAIAEAMKHTEVFPDIGALKTSHDRLVEKAFLRDIAGAPVVPFAAVESMAALGHFIKEQNAPVILKTRRFGYDGKGQIKLDSVRDVKEGFARLGGADLIAEGFAPFIREFSIIAVRGQNGEIKTWPLVENVHKHHRLHTSIAPANDEQNVAGKAQEIAHNILNALSYVGVMGIEFFELEGGQILVNEIAPRVHNSGHWTMDAGCASQFENHIRAIAGLKLASTKPKYKVKMRNLIGYEIGNKQKWAGDNCFVHDYDKREIKPGRKMGHVNQILAKI